MKFSIIAATQGRDTLTKMLDSCYYYQGVPAQIIICADTHDALLSDVRAICKDHPSNPLYIEHDAGFHDYGHPQAQVATKIATGSYLLYLGDDDVLEPGALNLLDNVMPDDNTIAVPHLFKIVMYPSKSRPIEEPQTLWKTQQLYFGGISAQNIVAPNIPEKLGSWAYDYVFIAQTIQRHDMRVVWRDEVIARCY